ncbi:MAG: DME family drug/metabolite transporter/O-acetylserine/cysteine efflux transporter [Alphaproteobacteria bacterium]|jgi:DME family drug/metabolite transporter/O-acetylserine/cysteine efflux transporter
MLIALCIVVIWGLNFVVITWGLEGLPPLLLGGLRFLLVASIGSLFFKRPSVPFAWWLAYAIPISFLQFAFLFSAMAYGMPAGLASLTLQAQALFTLLFAFLILKEAIKGYQLVAMIVAVFGLSLIAVSYDPLAMTALGFGLTMAAAAFWAMGNICTRSINNRGYKANVNLIIWSAWIPPIPFFIASLWFEGPEQIINSLLNFSWQSIASLLYLAVCATIIGYGLWSYLLSRYPAAQIAPLSLGVPIVGLTTANLLLNESISAIQWMGTAFVLIGLLMNTFGSRFTGKITVQAQ